MPNTIMSHAHSPFVTILSLSIVFLILWMARESVLIRRKTVCQSLSRLTGSHFRWPACMASETLRETGGDTSPTCIPRGFPVHHRWFLLT